MGAKIVPFEPLQPPVMSRPHAEEVIHRLARAGKFEFIKDFSLKMRVGDFTMRQVLETIKEGSVNQGPELDELSEWRCRVRRRVAGRLVRVVVAISANLDSLTLISVH